MNPIMSRAVALTKEDVDQAVDWYGRILAAKPNMSRTSRSSDERKEWNVVGKLAEVAVGRALGLSVDWEVWNGPGSSTNFTLRNGQSLDVRGIGVKKRMDYPFLLAVAPSEIQADLYTLVLVSPDRSHARLHGFATANELQNDGALYRAWRHRGKNDPLTLEQHQLHPFSELEELAKGGYQ
jgi:hypothetical protein